MRLNLDYFPLPIVMQLAGHTRCCRYLRTFFSLWLVFACRLPAAERLVTERAVMMDGAAHRGTMEGDRPTELTFRLEGSARLLRLREVRQISLTNAPVRQVASGPLRRVVLASGERLTGELRKATATGFAWTFFDGDQTIIPRSAIARIGHAADEFNFHYDDFERPPGNWIAEPGPAVLDDSRHQSGRQSLRLGPQPQELRYSLAEPLDSGRVELEYYDTAEVDADQNIVCEFTFGKRDSGQHVSGKDDAAESVQVLLAGAGQTAIIVTVEGDGTVLTDRQRIPRRPGWHRLSLKVQPGRFHLAINEEGLARGNLPDSGLQTIRLAARPALKEPIQSSDRNRQASLWIDDFKLYRPLASSALHSVPADPNVARQDVVQQDIIVRPDGDELCGTITELTPRRVTLRAVFGDVSLPWTAVADVHLRPAAGSGSPVSVTGWWARIELAGTEAQPMEDADWIWAALQSSTEEQLVLEHPALGRLTLPRERIRRIEPLFCGTRLGLEPGVRHLGDEIREGFRQPLPDGIEWQSIATLDQVPAGDAYFAVDAAELEPASSTTPRDRPLLSQLRAGHLRTELWVNGKLVEDLNRHVGSVVPSSRPVRLRIAIPDKLLKIGDNEIRLLQKPGSDLPSNYDDCELGNVALEFEP